MTSLFQDYWTEYHDKSLNERRKYFDSLNRDQQKHLTRSFFTEGWHELIIHNIIDDHLDFIKQTYDLDVLDLRIKVIKQRRAFLLEKKVWDHVLELISPYEDYFNTHIVLGNLKSTICGKYNNLCRIEYTNQK